MSVRRKRGILLALLVLLIAVGFLFQLPADDAAAPPERADGAAEPVGSPHEPHPEPAPPLQTRRERRPDSPAEEPPANDETRVEILVTDDGTPVGGARVLLMPRTAIRSRISPQYQQPARALAEGITDADGIVALACRHDRELRAFASRGGRAGVSSTFRLADAGTTSVETRLAAGLPARGLVFAAGKRAIDGAEISIALVGPVIPMGTRLGIGWTARTDELGRFDLGELPRPGEDESFVVIVRGRGFEDLDSDLAVAELESEPVVITVTGWVNVRGVVQFRNSSPAAGAQVRLSSQIVETAPDGSFALLVVGDTGGVIRVLGPTSHQLVAEVGPFSAEENDIGVLRVDAARRFIGRVVDERGDAVVGAVVEAQRRDYLSRRTTTDSDGRFEVFDTSDAPHDLRVLAPVARNSELMGNSILNAVGGGDDVLVELPSKQQALTMPLRILHGVEGQFPLRVTVALRRIGGGSAWSWRSAHHASDGARIDVPCPGRGEYALTLLVEDREPLRTEVDFTDANGDEIELVLPKAE